MAQNLGRLAGGREVQGQDGGHSVVYEDGWASGTRAAEDL